MNNARYDNKYIVIVIICLAFFHRNFAQNTSQYQDFDVHSYNIDLQVSDTCTFIEGNSTIYLENTSGDLQFIILELSNNLFVDSVLVNNSIATFSHKNDTLEINNDAYQYGHLIFVKVYYHGNGKGEKSRGVNTAYIEQYDQHITWTLCEPFYAKNWFPAKQDLNDKADSIIVSLTTDSGLIAVSNGLLYDTINLPDNKIKYKWKSNYPIAYYLISFAVSNYLVYEDSVYMENDTINFVNYIYNSETYLGEQKENIDATVDIINLFSELFGIYPFKEEKYGHAIAPVGGGMEHQTITTISDFNFELVAHELAHQWWGNLVTCSSWSDIWINEGFASYSEYLAYEFLYSKEKADEWLLKTKTNIITENSGSVYVSDSFPTVSRIFNHRLSYDKGAMIIHLLRRRINNDEIFFNILRSFLNEYAYKSAGADDFKILAEKISGFNLNEFFNSWFYGEGFPEINVQWQQTDAGLILFTDQDRNFETELHFRISYFNKNDTTINKIINGYQYTDTFQINGIVENIMIYPYYDHLILLKGISRIPSKSFCDDIIVAYDFIYKNWIIYFYRNSLYQIRLYDLQGKQLLNNNVTQNQYMIPASNINKGLYIIEIKEKDKVYRKKVINY